MTWSQLGVVILPLGTPHSTSLMALKKGFLHLRTYNAPQKIWQIIWKLETNVVIDKTRVVSVVFAFHGGIVSPPTI